MQPVDMMQQSYQWLHMCRSRGVDGWSLGLVGSEPPITLPRKLILISSGEIINTSSQWLTFDRKEIWFYRKYFLSMATIVISTYSITERTKCRTCDPYIPSSNPAGVFVFTYRNNYSRYSFFILKLQIFR